jgi:hypothetical protein
MKKTWVLALIAGLLLIAALTVSVTVAATVDLPQTGQTTSYYWEDDGHLKVGVAWPNPRFIDNSDFTITDSLTGLMWTRDGFTPTVGACVGVGLQWQDALNYVACLNGNNYLGYNDWRLPNVNELESLVNSGQSDTAVWLNSEGFTGARSDVYWSSTNRSDSADFAWQVSMQSGTVTYGSDKSGIAYVWPVRGSSTGSAKIWQTGQTTCYDASGNVIAK